MNSPYEVFTYQQSLFKYVDKNPCEILLAKDKENSEKGKKEYICFKTFNDFKKYCKINNFLYELIRENTECKLYFDIEYDTKNEAEEDIKFNDVFERIKTSYAEYFGHKLNDDDIYISTASGWKNELQYKHSFHIVIDNGLYFKNNKEIEQFALYVNKEGIDRSVYKNNGLMRMLYQTKIGSKRFLKPINGNYENHLICRYPFCEFKGYYEYNTKTTFGGEKCSLSLQKPVYIGFQGLRENSSDDYKNIDKNILRSANASSLHSYLGTPNTERIFENDEVKIESVESMLECLGNHGYHWEIFFAICCIVKNEGLPFEVFEKWCSKSKKYDPSSSKQQWNTLKKRQGYNKATLRNMLYYKYPNLKKTKTTILLDQITEPTIVMENYGYDTIEYCKKYCDSIVELSEKYPLIVLKSHLGTGKSTTICDLVKKRKFKSIVCITPRMMYANSIYGELKKAEPNFKLYKDVEKNDRPKENFIVCQMESLTTLADEYELVIFDESESLLAQFHSETMKENFDLITEKFELIMKKAKNILCADAFITNRTLCLMKLIRPEEDSVYIENTFQPYRRECYKIGKTDKQMVVFYDKFKKLNPDDRNIICTGSRKNSEALFSKSLNKKNTLLINSYSSDKYAKELQNVNNFWEQYQDVIYTSSITVGVSYDSEKEFDNLFLHFSVFGCLVRDMFQGSLRARKIKNNVLYYSHFSSYYGDERPYVFEFNKLMEIIEYREKDKDKKMKEWVKHLWVYNEKELNTNARFHEELINRYLYMCGYTKNVLELEIQVNKDEEKMVKDINYDYEDINQIGWEESQKIYKKIVKGEAETQDKLEYLKYQFNYETLHNYEQIDLQIRKSMFASYLQHKDKIIEKIRNIKYENNANKHVRYFIYHENMEQKRASIMKIIELLGIEKSFDINQISREKLEVMRNYFNANVDYIQNIWKLPKNFWFNKLKEEPQKNIYKRTIGTLQTIFSQWAGCDFKRGERKKKRIQGETIDVSNFVIKPQEYIEPFIEDTKKYFKEGKCRLICLEEAMTI